MNPHVVLFTARAERQLARLYRYIADQSGQARAEAYVTNLVAACQSLSAFPLRGADRSDIRSGLRTLGFKKTATIAFSVNSATQTVAIHGVFYGGQDFETLLRGAEAED